jgi:hypothetical protein
MADKSIVAAIDFSGFRLSIGDLLTVRNPSESRSPIAFTAWSKCGLAETSPY